MQEPELTDTYNRIRFPRDFVKWWVMEHGIDLLDINTNVVTRIEQDYFELSTLWRAARDPQRRYLPQVKRAHLEGAYELLLEEANAELLRSQRSNVACTGENLSYLAEWVRCVTGSETELDIAIMAHFVWQVKRKFFGLQETVAVREPLMPVLFGEPNAGKTTACQVLMQPFVQMNRAWENASFTDISDPRNWYRLHVKYITFVDEMAGWENDKTMNTWKVLASGNTFEPRILRTNSNLKIRQNSTFIGTSNVPLREIVRIPGLARRMAQINSLPKGSLQVKQLLQLDAVKIWQGIDETRGGAGYLEGKLQLLEARQGATAPGNSLALFCKSVNLVVPGSQSSKRVTSNTIFSNYKTWCEENDFEPESDRALARYLVNYLSIPRWRERRGSQVSGYVVPASCLLEGFEVVNGGTDTGT